MSSAAEHVAKMATGSKDVPWFHKTPLGLSAAARELLQKYSHISADQVNLHVIKIRERAWSIFPYPCIGTHIQQRMLSDSLASFPAFE